MRRCSPLLAFSALPVLLLGCASEDNGAVQAQPQVGDLVDPMPTTPMTSGSGSASPGGSSSAPATPAQPAPDVGAVISPDVVEEEAFVDEPIDQEAVEAEAICESSSEGTSLQDVVLAFAFDVSGSMGIDESDRTLKWEPIVAATKAFFADEASEGMLATMTFFPSGDVQQFGGGGGGLQGGGGDVGGADPCSADSYQTPDVGMTQLPSPDFATAIDAIEPDRIGTPTMAVLQGTIDSVRAMQDQEEQPANYAIVLVTDGVPQLCSDEQNAIENVAAVAGEVAAEIPVYVIGVDSPSGVNGEEDVDGLGNLNLIAQQGGTGNAFIIDTGNPEQTIADFKVVIEEIRETAFSCNVQIPEAPEGEVFDSELVNVSYSNDVGVTELTYDEGCGTDFGWRYDSADSPTLIELCPSVCEAIKADVRNQGQLNVEFGCERRVDGAR